MPPTDRAEPIADEAAARRLLDEDRHYVDAVTALGDRQPVIASADIVAANGVKLVAKGAAIDSRLRDKLAGHRLRQSIDRCLATGDAVDGATLARAAALRLDSQPFWRHLATRSGDPLAMRHGLAALALPGPLAFRLTVARTERPVLYEHCVGVALLCHYLALRLGWPEARIMRLLLAALCHDLGEMHTDPALFAPGRRIGDAERQFVYVHPLTGSLILGETPGVPPEVARAVLHHHERLDGSGYPAGLRADRIEPLARPLMVADTVESVLARFSDPRRLSALLRLNRRKYDADAVAALHEALQTMPGAAPAAPRTASDPAPRLRALADVLGAWQDFRNALGGPRDGLDFLDTRLGDFRSLLLQFGFDPEGFDALVGLAREDGEVADELAQVLDELRFQLADLVHEIDRRAGTLAAALGDSERSAFEHWRATLRAALDAA